MTRLIDADALEEELVSHKYKYSPYLHFLDVAVTIERMPTIDAVPVVRCKDCKMSEVFQNDSSGVMARYCNAFRLIRMVADDDYCSYGERRNDETDRRRCTERRTWNCRRLR